MSKPIPGRGGERNEQTGGEILPTHIYRTEGKRRWGLLLGLVIFRLVTPPLQLGVMGPYPVRGVWFPSPLLLEGTNRIQNCRL
jgi:hypothetical protein